MQANMCTTRIAFGRTNERIRAMKMKRLLEKYTPEELAEAFVFRTSLTPVEQARADKQLNEHRLKMIGAMTPEQRVVGDLFRLRFLIEDYVKSPEYDAALSFGHFLRDYIRISYKANKDFAADLGIKETELSQLLNNHRAPSEKILIRLEVHSNSMIKAGLWNKLVEKEREHEIETNQELRISESKFVKKLELNIAK